MPEPTPYPDPLSPHPLVARLLRREPVTALGVRFARSPEIARIAKASGHDVIWLDLEHCGLSVEQAGQICLCAHDLGLHSLVRVPEHDLSLVGRLLDGGAGGIIAPRIETVEQAAQLVAACRFAPQGQRSAITRLAQFNYEAMPPEVLFERANRATLVNVLVESPLGIANLAEILQVPGIDLVSIGTNDLCAELQVPGQPLHPRVREAHAQALATCRQAGMPLSIGGVGDAARNAELISQGAVPYLMTGFDTDLLLSSATERVRQALSTYLC